MKKILFVLTLIFSAGALFAQSGQRQIGEEARSHYHSQQEAMKAARNTGIEEPTYEEKVAAKAEAAKTAADEETAKKEFIEKLGKNIGHHARAAEYVRVFMEEGPAAYRTSLKPSTFKLGKDFKTDVVKNRTALMTLGENVSITFFIQKGANINLQDNDGNTALHLAAKENNLDAVRTLLSAGADVNIKNKKGQKPVQMSNRHPTQALIKKAAK